MLDNVHFDYSIFRNGHPKFGFLTLFFIMLPMMYASVVAGIRKVCNVENPEPVDKSKQDIKKVCTIDRAVIRILKVPARKKFLVQKAL